MKWVVVHLPSPYCATVHRSFFFSCYPSSKCHVFNQAFCISLPDNLTFFCCVCSLSFISVFTLWIHIFSCIALCMEVVCVWDILYSLTFEEWKSSFYWCSQRWTYGLIHHLAKTFECMLPVLSFLKQNPGYSTRSFAGLLFQYLLWEEASHWPLNYDL
jgi:hypothetical protein